MQAKVYCRTEKRGQQSFYLFDRNKEYYLFTQDYRSSVKEFFQHGVSIDATKNFAATHSTAVKRTLEKLKTYIPYIEKEYGIAVLKKTQKKGQRPWKNRSKFRLDDWYEDMAE